LNDLTGQEYARNLKAQISSTDIIQKISDLAVFLVLEGPTQPFWIMEFVLAGGIDYLLRVIEKSATQQNITEEDNREIFGSIRCLRLLMNVSPIH
jgi:hypothetical protein